MTVPVLEEGRAGSAATEPREGGRSGRASPPPPGQPGDNAGLEHHNLVMELAQGVGEEHREQELVQEEGGGAL